jgi:hypothetical protein
MPTNDIASAVASARPLPTRRRETIAGRKVQESSASTGRLSRLAASRILSETAHDLRSPLTSVREAIRLVASGDMGAVNDGQADCLIGAIDLCDSMERLVVDMLQIERLQAGRLRPRRSWFSLNDVRINVTSALDSLLRPRQVSLVWDGIDANTPHVYGDMDKVSRLIANLAANAARETRERQSVLIRAAMMPERESMIVSVIDSGRGMDIDQWNDVARRGVSDHGSEGLGLSICRQLAAAHFSALTVVSREGRGTEVSFELPVGGASSVVMQWATWRSLQRMRVVPRRAIESDADAAEAFEPCRFFEDEQTRLLLLHHDGPPPMVASSAMILTVAAGAMMPRKSVEAFDARLQQDQRLFDFVYRVHERCWVVVWDMRAEDVKARVAQLSTPVQDQDAGALRLSWSDARPLSIGSRQTATMLVDTITREVLGEREPAGMYDDDMASDGSSTLPGSMVPEERLRDELSRLSTRLSNRSERLCRQARSARP